MRKAAFLLPLFLLPAAHADTPGLSMQGETRMGVVWDRPAAAPGSDRAEARLYARTELKLKFVGETDGGLRFGAELDLDKLGSDTSNPRRGQSVFIGN